MEPEGDVPDETGGNHAKASAARSQRWRARRSLFVPNQEDFDPRSYGVEPISDRVAKAFVVEHHYSGSYPASILPVGLYRTAGREKPELVGTAVFSVPMNARSAGRYGAPEATHCDLGRLCLLDDVPGNAETWFLRRAMRALAREKTRADGRPKHDLILAYSDPIARTSGDGRTVMPGHVGAIYGKAGSAIYLGRATARRLLLDREGKVVSERMLSKIRSGERGAEHGRRRLLDAGAPEPLPFEPIEAWLKRAVTEGPFRTLKHPGNLAYGYPRGSHSSRSAMTAAIDRKATFPGS